jgi:dipeptidyl aminopeptidase/acylaminoacyl peptidase
MRKFLFAAYVILFILPVMAQQNASVSFEKWISLKSIGTVVMSPDGKFVAYTVTSTDWVNNSYDSEIWLYREGETPFQLTRTTKGSSSSPQFTPDSKYVSFLADRGDKTQIYLIPVNGGEAFAVTKDEDGIGGYEWSPDGKYIAVTKTEQDSKKEKTSKERYGGFAVEGEEYKLNHLWLLHFNIDSVMAAGQLPCYTSKADSLNKNKLGDCVVLPKAARLTEGNYTVSGFRWSPDGKYIAFTRQPDPLINSSAYADIAVIEVVSKKSTLLINNPGGDFFIDWSPDGKQMVYSSSVTDTVSNYYKNNRVFIYDFSSKTSREMAAGFDENKNVITWNEKGICFTATLRTKTGIFIIDVPTGKTSPFNTGLDVAGFASFNKGADRVALTGRNFTGLTDVFIADGNHPLQKLSNMSEQVTSWNTPVNEVIQWKSKDGVLIDGVLLKPRNYDPKKKYPLLVVIHGGPTGVDRPEPTPTYVYPIIQWCERGAVVLRVNYRGSAGYGEKFRALNVRNLGIQKWYHRYVKNGLYGMEPGRIYFRFSYYQYHHV